MRDMKEQRISEKRVMAVLTAAREALGRLDVSVKAIKYAVKIITDRDGDIVVTGIGKSGFIGQKLAASLTSLGERSFFIHPTEALHGDLGVLSKGDVLISLSFSGESKEVLGITKYAKKSFGVPVIALSKSSKSSLSKVSDCFVEVPVLDEGSPNGIAPMASTTAMLVLSDMIVAGVMNDSFKDEHFATYHPGGSLGLRLKKVSDFMIKKDGVPNVKEKANFLDAVREINKKKLGVTAVTRKNNQLIGVITDGDVRRFVLSNKKTETVLVDDVMTRIPKYVYETDSLFVALSIMENYKITSIFVVNKGNKLKGVIHIHNILEQTV
ncbi:MAG: D-arabinose 5-phosphate isomerase [Candidatus Parcubacteria bacterium]|jgi:arabinose-5-phosphate isomerase